MKEKQLQTILGQILVKANLPFPACLELKMEKGNSFNFSKVADHQLYYLKKAKDGLYYKIPDMYSMDGFAAKKPFDCLWMVSPVSCVVICFYKPRQPKEFYFIDVDDFISMKQECLPKKSITRDTLNSDHERVMRVLSSDNLRDIADKALTRTYA